MTRRAEIIANLDAQRRRIEAWFRALSPEALLQPVTASEIPGETAWTPKDHLAHVIGVERYFHGVVRRALEGAEDPAGLFTQVGSDTDRGAIMAVINQSNARAARKYRDDPADALFARLDQARATTLALLERVSDEQLTQSAPHSPFGDGTIGGLFLQIGSHDAQHLGWLTEAVG